MTLSTKSDTNAFEQEIKNAYTCKEEGIIIGSAILNNEPIPGLQVTVPLKTINRHGLIAGATGTGKTKTIQKFSESLSKAGVSVLLMDIKGDLSGISQQGTPNPKIEERIKNINIDWSPNGFPCEFLTLSKEEGIRLRATVSEFGPVLFSKMLELNENQAGVVSLIFKYADDKGLPLIDLKDFRKLVQYLTNEGKEDLKEYGAIQTVSTGTILRKIVEIEEQGADTFFGERSFDVEDLTRVDEKGRGYLNILRLSDIQDKPKLFSTFMLSLLSEIYQKFPEEGDLEAPKLVLFIDEAHLIFKEASKELIRQLESVVKLIRSKGVGIIFCTQDPVDIPEEILGQLGIKIQHALRAFTAKDRKAIKLISENYPSTNFYVVEELITSLGIGEAIITVLSEEGKPTPLVHTMMAPPESRMDIISQEELSNIVKKSDLYEKYNEIIDRESAYEILTTKMTKLAQEEKVQEKEKPKSQGMPVGELVTRQVGRTLASELTRGLVRGLLGGFLGGAVASAVTGTTRRRTRSKKRYY